MEKMKNDNLKNLRIVILLFCALVLFWGLFSVRSHAMNQQVTLPIYVDPNDFPFGVDFYQNYINSHYGGFWNLKGDNTIGWCSIENGQVLQTFAVWQDKNVPFSNYFTTNINSMNGQQMNNSYPYIDYNNITITLTFTNLANTNNKPIRLFTFYVNLNTQQVNLVAFNTTSTINKGVYGNTGAKLNYVSTPIYFSYGGNNYPQYMIFTNSLEDVQPETVPGETVEPDLDNLDDGLTKPTFPTAPNITPPTTTTPPNIDTTSQSAFWSSLGDLLKWGFGELRGILQYIGQLIVAWLGYIGQILDYIGDLIDYWLEIIKRAIQGLAKNIYDNFTNFFKPLIDKINETIESIETSVNDFVDGFTEFADLFIHPFDEEEFEEQIENCQLISQYNELMDNCDDIRAIFNNAVERDYFVLYIDFENPFADSEHKIIHSEISFTWLKDYRTTYRPFLWLFTMIECFVGGLRLLGGIIGGKAK